MLTKSIRWRFVFWLAFLLVCVLSGFGFTAYQLHQTNQFGQLDEELKSRVAALSGNLRAPSMPGNRGGGPKDRDQESGPPPDPSLDGRFGGPRRFERSGPPPDLESRDDSMPRKFHISSETANLFEEITPNGFYYAKWSRNAVGVFGGSTNAPKKLSQPEKPGNNTGTFFRNHDQFREAFHYTERGDCILVGRSIVAEITASRRFLIWLVAGGVAVLALGISGVWLMAGRVLAPVEAITTAATRISDGNLSERINVSETDNELGQLANTLNSTFARLESSFARQKQFTADASHELRTPLAVLISEAQTSLARERTASEYRQTIEACLETGQQMRRLIESLLELAHLDASQQQSMHEPVDLADVVRACVDLTHSLADKRGIRIHCELSPAKTRGNASHLGQVITNLITNAIHYNNPDGKIHIRAGVQPGFAVISINDTGVGIATNDLPFVFDRFYRADKSRSRSEGRSGLGLAICKAIVEAHSGSITVASQVNVGTTFKVSLPVMDGTSEIHRRSATPGVL